ncbi:hypothetical protein [Longivirga aurantiaca]|uniref:Uncharacterized protein n=1 Tax=Longivirga aurantiaca TaxID=1837743 RepID=A0ABW1T120_9ACTN
MVPLSGVARVDASMGPLEVEVVAIRCNSRYCFVRQNVRNLGKQRERFLWPETLIDAKGVPHRSCCGDVGLAGASIPPGHSQPMFVEWSLPAELTLVAMEIGAPRIELPRPLDLTQQESDLTPDTDYGDEVPIGVSVSADTEYGAFQVTVDSIACRVRECRITQHATGLDQDANWRDYPAYLQQALDAAGGRHAALVPWPGDDPRYGPMVHSAWEAKEFYATFDIPAGTRLTQLIMPGAAKPVRLPLS